MGSVVNKLAFLPPQPYDHTLEDLQFIDTVFQGKNRKIPYVYFIVNPDRPTILYTHGNAEDLRISVQYLRVLCQLLETNILAFDYCGYGLHSIRDPSEEEAFNDIQIVWDFLTKKVQPRNVIIFGRSLGTGPSSHLAYQLFKKKENSTLPAPPAPRSGFSTLFNWLPSNSCKDEREAIPFDPQEVVGGLILQSPLESATRVVTPWSVSGLDIFQNWKYLPSVLCPVFILHGDRDTVVPFEHGKNLFDKVIAKEKVFWQVTGCGHNDMTMHQEFFIKLKQFIDTKVIGNPNPKGSSFFSSSSSSSSSSSTTSPDLQPTTLQTQPTPSSRTNRGLVDSDDSESDTDQ